MTSSVLAILTAIILCLGILTCWITGQYSVTAFQNALFLLTIITLLYRQWKHRPIELHWLIAVPLFGSLLAVIQIVFKVTVNQQRTLLACILWLSYAAVVFLVLQFGVSTRHRTAFLSAMLWFATAIAVLGTIQNFTSDGKVFWIFDSGYTDLVLGPFVYRNKYAQFVELFLPVALWRAITQPQKMGSSFTMAAMMLAGSIAGGSRSGVAIALIETIIVLLIIRRKGLLTEHRLLRIGVQIGLLVLICGSVVGWEFLGKRLRQDPLADIRIPIIQGTIDMIKARPVLGFGLGTWDKAYPEFSRFDNGLYTNQAHSDWFQWPAEGGVFFLVTMLAVAALALSLGLRHPWCLGVFFVFIHGLIDYPMQQVPQFAALVFAMLALAVGETISRRRQVGFTNYRRS